MTYNVFGVTLSLKPQSIMHETKTYETEISEVEAETKTNYCEIKTETEKVVPLPDE